ncbi:MAG: leucine-rich repeat protein [Oscillibacter sp.]|nr:leucine-rich repeat protein [Oscillibacter sp.]MBQ2996980.1 leucine-rich repeat protein [Oscillibacter sp.]
MKKTLRIFLLTLLMAVCLCAFASAAEGTCGDGVSWAIDSSGRLTVSGSGEITSSPWWEHRDQVTSIVVEEGITALCSDAFAGLASAAEVKLPSRLNTIPYGAFSSCRALKEIMVPDGVTEIDTDAFYGCTALRTVYFPASLTSVRIKAFEKCNNLTTIHYGGTAEQWSGVSVGLLNGSLPNATVIPGWEGTSSGTAVPDTLSGECGVNGGNVRWTLDTAAGVLTLSGTGEMEQFGYYGAPWYNYREMVKTAVVGEGVAYLGACSFQDCQELTGVTLPGSLTTIGNYAFENCTALTEIDLPEGLATILDEAFSGSGLRSVTVPESVTWLEGAFENCAELVSAKLPSGMKELYSNTFKNCVSLVQAPLPQRMTDIDSGAFFGCVSLKALTIPETVERIGENAFAESGLTAVTIPAGAKSVEWRAFQNCPSLARVDFAASCAVTLGAEAFDGCDALREVVLPAGVKLGNKCFAGSGLEKVTFLGDTVEMVDVNYVGDCAYIFQNCTALKEITLPAKQTRLVHGMFAGCSALERIVLPEGITVLPNSLFWNCTSLKEVSMGSGVTAIEHNAFENCASLERFDLPEDLQVLGQSVFLGCTALREMKIPTAISVLPYETFSDCTALERVELPAALQGIDGAAFENCVSLAAIDLPGGVDTLAYGAFRGCSALTEVMLPDSVTTLSGNLFRNCAALTAVRIPAGVTRIEAYTFTGAPVKTVYYGGTEEQWNAVSGREEIPSDAVVRYQHAYDSPVLPDSSGSCGAGVTWSVEGDTLTISGSGAMTDYAAETAVPWQVWRNEIRRVVVEEGVTAIGDNTFTTCRGALETVDLAGSVKHIGARAFSGCEHLTEVELPETLETLGAYAFSNCGIKTLYLPDSFREFTGENTFSGCNELETVRLSENLAVIQNGAFQMCEKLKSIHVPASVEAIGHAAFRDCSSLTEAYLPDSITLIGYEAFGGRIGLEKVYYGGSQADWSNVELYWLSPWEGHGNTGFDYAEFVFDWDGWETAAKYTVTGKIPTGEVWVTVEEADGSTSTSFENGEFSISAGAAPFTVVIGKEGCLSYTVKDVTESAVLGEIELLAGDVNADEKINMQDLRVFLQNFNKTGEAIGESLTDVTEDSKVNMQDLRVFLKNFNKTAEKDCTVIYGA